MGAQKLSELDNTRPSPKTLKIDMTIIKYGTIVNTKVVNLKVEPYDIYIGRPSVWGNPFSHKKFPGLIQVESVEKAVELYDDYIQARIQYEPEKYVLSELKGKVLGCFCKPGPCHGDVLVRLADEL